MFTKYTYSIQNDFPQHVVATDRLTGEIQASAISIALDRIDTVGDVCDIWFKDVLSGGDEATLAGLVAAHTGVPLPAEVVEVSVQGPKDLGGKPFYSPNIYPDGNYRYLTGRSDNLSEPNLDLARGKGTKFQITQEATGPSTPLEFGFVDPVWIAGGSIVPHAAEFGDTCSMQVYAPSSSVTSTPGAGNCVVVDPGVGMPCLIVPVPAGGTHTVDLATAVPIPWGDDWVDRTDGWSWWNWTDGGSDPPLTGPGVITPNYQQKGRFNLFTIPITLVTHANEVPLHGSMGQQTLTLAAIETKLVLPQWRFKVWVDHAAGSLPLKVAWYFDLGRAKT